MDDSSNLHMLRTAAGCPQKPVYQLDLTAFFLSLIPSPKQSFCINIETLKSHNVKTELGFNSLEKLHLSQ